MDIVIFFGILVLVFGLLFVAALNPNPWISDPALAILIILAIHFLNHP